MTGGAPGDGGAATGLVAASAQPWSAPGGDVGVLVLHGFTGNPTSMRPLARRLADDGMAVELPLLPGHGTHWRDLARTTWQDWAREATADLVAERTIAFVRTHTGWRDSDRSGRGANS